MITTLQLSRPEAIPPAPPDALQSPNVDAWYDRWVPHPGRRLRPTDVVQIYAQAEYGYPQQQCDMFDDIIENDGHLRSILEGRREAVAGKDWIVQAGGDSKVDHEAATLLEQALREVPNFGETVEHQLEALWYGYAGSELAWDVATNGTIAPVWFANTPARRFIFNEYDEPRLITKGNFASGEPVQVGLGHWLFSRRRGRRIAMGGAMRTAVWWALFKRMSVRDWASFVERFGIPLPIGKYTDGMTDKEKEALKRTVAMIGKEGYAAISALGVIEFAQVSSPGSIADVHPGLATFCNAEMSKLINGATLTSGEGTSTGSYALGRVHENASFNLVTSDAKKFGIDWFSTQVGKPFCVWNGLKAAPPRLKINVVRELDPAVRLNNLRTAFVDLRIPLSKEQVRQENQIKAPLNDEDTLTPVEPPTPALAPAASRGAVG